MISSIKIVGSLVYRTREALNSNKGFMEALKGYTYAGNCLIDGKFYLWHYPGTQPEISAVLVDITDKFPVTGSRVKFPAFLDFQPMRQDIRFDVNAGSTLRSFDMPLAIAGTTNSKWLTEQRDVQDFDLLLRPIYDEFMNQIVKSGYFLLDYGLPAHTLYDVFTTGNNSGVLLQRYGEYIDAIELHGLRLTLKPSLCKRDFDKIEYENGLVTANITEILKM